jgi:chromatin structure-remodeling complex subunit RSC1/2
MAGDAIEVRESIEAKGDADKDVTMTDAVDAPNENADEDAPGEEDAEGEDVDAEGEPDDEVDADADADGEADPDADAEGEPDDGDVAAQQRRDIRQLIHLIDECQAYLSNYKDAE